MKQNWLKNAALLGAIALLAPVTMIAQQDKVEKVEKVKKETQQIVITRKGGKDEKIVIEVNGDKVLVNGKPLEEYKDKDGNIKVHVHDMKDWESLSFKAPRGEWNVSQGGDAFTFLNSDENRAMLGVTTEKVTEGASIESVTKGSAAEKAGLKENDIITKVGDKKIEEPDDLSKAIKNHKPGDKVDISYLRDKKEQLVKVELTKWKGVFQMDKKNFNLDLKDLHVTPRVYGPDSKPSDQFRTQWSGGSPKLGLSVQDSDDGKGVSVVQVDDESNAAKAGIKKDDIITQIDDKAVNNVDEVTRILKEKKDNPTVRFQLIRNGKSQNIEVKMPRKIKTANL